LANIQTPTVYNANLAFPQVDFNYPPSYCYTENEYSGVDQNWLNLKPNYCLEEYPGILQNFWVGYNILPPKHQTHFVTQKDAPCTSGTNFLPEHSYAPNLHHRSQYLSIKNQPLLPPDTHESTEPLFQSGGTQFSQQQVMQTSAQSDCLFTLLSNSAIQPGLDFQVTLDLAYTLSGDATTSTERTGDEDPSIFTSTRDQDLFMHSPSVPTHPSFLKECDFLF
jgi:hypothetical protein